ncbi:MAG: ferrous iron transport protein B [Firmicutes bacterium]|nr:ferrous iron transport protein B [Bacillota bacterium]
MGLTNKSTGSSVLNDLFDIQARADDEFVVALAGNPNTGKSTVFNSLTGMNQHTGNWPGKTVTNAQGRFHHDGDKYLLVDLPGTYSLLANSVEEEVARDFICFGRPDVTVVVADSTCLERNLNLVLQVMELTDRVVLVVNLLDEARRKQIKVDIEKLSQHLGIPVVGTNARDGEGLVELRQAVARVAKKERAPRPLRIKYTQEIEAAALCLEEQFQEVSFVNKRWLALRLLDGDVSITRSLAKYTGISLDTEAALKQCQLSEAAELRDLIVENIVQTAEAVAAECVTQVLNGRSDRDRKIDRILTSRIFGFPSMLLLLGLVFWITIEGAEYPSEMLADGLFWVEAQLSNLFVSLSAPDWLHSILVLGVYRTLAWVVAVMLPPMAIFFPLFTLLEDLGYLPRVAFNMDRFFKRAGAHGKQALTMCMGFGCNAAGVIGCRIIDSPRERLIAIITNNFVPCNGRFPILIAMALIFIGSTNLATLSVVAVIVLGIVITLLVSKLLSLTILKGIPSSFALELPPYRRPKIGQVIVRSIFDRTIFVLGRAILVAAPAGLIIWVAANIDVGGVSILNHGANFLSPLADLMGLDGFILMAFILGMPANEIVIPIIIMSYLATGAMLEFDSLTALRDLLAANGWTWLTAVNVMILTLLHFPCGTTLLTIRKETNSWRWTVFSFLIPTIAGIVVCIAFTQLVRLVGYIL